MDTVTTPPKSTNQPEKKETKNTKKKIKPDVPSTTGKRTFVCVDPDSTSDEEEEENIQIADSWPRFLMIQPASPETPISKLSPFAIQKGIEGIAGNPSSVKRLRSGDILVEVNKKCHSDNLLQIKTFVNIPVKVSPHRTLNTKKGVIRCPQFKDCSEEEIVRGTKKHGVIAAKRIFVTRAGEKVRTGTVILTFALPSLPTGIDAAYLYVRVDPYIPNPLRCFKCQRFGHHKNNCKRKAACAKCGSGEHDDSSCTETHLCVNCKGPHTAFSRDCPEWVKEKEIQQIKHTQNLPYPEAKKVVEASRPNNGSYSQVVQQNIQQQPNRVQQPVVQQHAVCSTTECLSVSCQTSDSWMFETAPFKLPDDSDPTKERIITPTPRASTSKASPNPGKLSLVNPTKTKTPPTKTWSKMVARPPRSSSKPKGQPNKGQPTPSPGDSMLIQWNCRGFRAKKVYLLSNTHQTLLKTWSINVPMKPLAVGGREAKGNRFHALRHEIFPNSGRAWIFLITLSMLIILEVRCTGRPPWIQQDVIPDKHAIFQIILPGDCRHCSCRNIMLIQWNCRGFRANFDEIGLPCCQTQSICYFLFAKKHFGKTH